MMKAKLKSIKQEMRQVGQLLWDKDLVTGLNGNISMRLDDATMAITATKVCLGMIRDEDILLMNLNGEMPDEGQVSTERNIHLDIYNANSDANIVIHTHTPYINGYFLERKVFNPRIMESKLYIGRIEGIDQTTPSVTDTSPVIESLKSNNIVVLRQHGVLAIGKEALDALWLIQGLEEAIMVDSISRLYQTEQGKDHDEDNDTKADQGSSYASQISFTIFL